MTTIRKSIRPILWFTIGLWLLALILEHDRLWPAVIGVNDRNDLVLLFIPANSWEWIAFPLIWLIVVTNVIVKCAVKRAHAAPSAQFIREEDSVLPRRCPQCSYSLDGIATTICPECGIDTNLLRDSLFRDHVECMVTTSVCYGIAGGIWLVIALVLGVYSHSALVFGIILPIAASHFLVGYLMHRRRFRLLSGMRYMRHSSLLSKLSLAFSSLMLAVTLAMMA